MEIVVLIIMALVCLSVLLKLTYHGWKGRIILSGLCALFIILSYEAATEQSKAQIADWLGQPELMLDMSVWLTIDVAFQICFCVLAAKALSNSLSPTERIMKLISLWIPGILIFPVLLAILTETIFTMTGMDFLAIARTLGLTILILFPVLASFLKWMIPEKDIRLEMMFMINLIIAVFGIAATVNGRTAAVGTNEVEWGALTGFIAIMMIGTLAGLLLHNRENRRNANKILK